MSLCLFLAIFVLQESAPAPEIEAGSLKSRLLNDIQAVLDTRVPIRWDITDPYNEINLSWNPQELSNPISYTRRFDGAPGGGLTLIETWTMAPGDLPILCKVWGHPGVVTWDSLLANLPSGRILASQDRGTLVVLRDLEYREDARRFPPFPLDLLPTANYPYLAEGNNRKVPPAEGRPRKTNAFASFLADLFLEEVLDKDGVPLSVSKKWHFQEDFSRLTPKLRIERRLRLDFDGTYSVFDIYGLEGEFLAGSRDKLTDDGFSELEAGAFINARKRVVIIRKGYRKWYKALFAPIFNPRKLPYNQKKLADLPRGVRILLPATVGLSVGERRKDGDILDDKFPLQLNTSLGLQGSFMVSVTKRGDKTLDLRFGGSIERQAAIDLRGRPDFDGPFDPSRLLFGTFLRWRWHRGQGTRLFFQQVIDLDDAEQTDAAIRVIRQGISLDVATLSLLTVFNFSILPRFDAYLLQQFADLRVPELDWERAVRSRYVNGDFYAKIGIRPITFRTRTQTIDDKWVIQDLKNQTQTSGRSGYFRTNRAFRFLNSVDRRNLMVRTVALETEAKADRFIELVDLYAQSKMYYNEYQDISGKILRGLDDIGDISRIKDMPPQHAYKNAELGYRLLISPEGMAHLSEFLKEVKREQPQHEISRWLRYRPLLYRAFKRSWNDPQKCSVATARILFRIAKAKGPLHALLKELEPDEFQLQWRVMSESRLFDQGREGDAELPRPLFEAWKTWEELEVLDSIFIDRDFSARFR